MFISTVKLYVLTRTSMVTDSLLEPAAVFGASPTALSQTKVPQKVNVKIIVGDNQSFHRHGTYIIKH